MHMQQRVKLGMSTLQQRQMRARVAPYEKKKSNRTKEERKTGHASLQNRHANASNAPKRKKGRTKKEAY